MVSEIPQTLGKDANMVKKRRGERYPSWPGVEIEFTPQGGAPKVIANSSNIHEISRVGCSIKSSNIEPLRPGDKGTLKFSSKECEDKIENTEVIRKWNDGLALSFSLTPLVDRYCNRTSPDSLEFARMDYEQVHREVMDIKSCRTNIFVGTIGVIGAIAVAILGILNVASSTRWQYWLLFASIVPALLLVSSMLSTIHKARGITKRVGYMEALGEYLSIGKIPRFFGGWHKASRVKYRCQRYIQMKITKMQASQAQQCKQVEVTMKLIFSEGEKNTETSTLSLDDKDLEFCNKIAKDNTSNYLKGISMVPSMLDSFTSLSTHIYTIAFFISIVSLLAAVFEVIRTRMSDAPLWLFWMLVCSGALISSLFVRRCMNSMKDTSSNSLQSNKQGERFFKIYRYIAGFILPICLIVLLLGGNSNIFSVTVLYITGAIISAIGVSVAYSFYEKIRSLRKGRYSIQRWRHIWKIRFKRCPLMIEETQID